METSNSFLGGARDKAGMPLERDKIDEIIKNASKGSKYYEHQQRREQRIQEKIGKILAKKRQYEKMFARDSLALDKSKGDTERSVISLEAERDLSKTMVCIDMDAFFAAVETLDNPEYANLPMAVGGWSMLSTSNYEARKYGVVSAMPGYIALKLCPQLKLVEPNFEKYRSVASKFHEVFRRYDEHFTHYSLDEATLDISHLITKDRSAEDIVSQLRKEVFEVSGLTCSAGISANKMLAKICSNINKPNGQYYLRNDRDSILEFIHNTKLSKINGIGKVSAKLLEGVLGAVTVGQLWEQRFWIKLLFSDIQSEFLLRCCLGVGYNYNMDAEGDRQSISTERTFPTLTDLNGMLSILGDLCNDLSKQLDCEALAGKNVSIKMKDANFNVTTRALTLKKYVWKEKDIFEPAKQLLTRNHPQDLRLLGVRMSMLESVENIDVEESLEQFVKKNKVEGNLLKCPICLQSIPGAYVEESVESLHKLNDHVDQCLSKGVANQSSQPVVKEEIKPETIQGIERFFKKKK